MTRPHDTSADAAANQWAAYRRMSPEERVRIAAEMSNEIRALAEAGIRDRHPDYSDGQVGEAMADILLGRSLAEAARENRRSPGR